MLVRSGLHHLLDLLQLLPVEHGLGLAGLVADDAHSVGDVATLVTEKPGHAVNDAAAQVLGLVPGPGQQLTEVVDNIEQLFDSSVLEALERAARNLQPIRRAGGHGVQSRLNSLLDNILNLLAKAALLGLGRRAARSLERTIGTDGQVVLHGELAVVGTRCAVAVLHHGRRTTGLDVDRVVVPYAGQRSSRVAAVGSAVEDTDGEARAQARLEALSTRGREAHGRPVSLPRVVAGDRGGDGTHEARAVE